MNPNQLPKPRSAPLLRWLLRVFFRFFFHFKAEGQENLPSGGPLLLASNHQSYYDPMIVAIGQDHPVCFMTWAALFRYRLFAWLIRWGGAFPVDLDRLDVGAFRIALESLRRQQWVVIFPEAGRTADGNLLELREGVARLSLHTGAPIVPIRIEGAFEVWPKPRPLPHLFGTIRVFYGPPIVPPRGRLSQDERNRVVESMMGELRAFLEQKSIASPKTKKIQR